MMLTVADIFSDHMVLRHSRLNPVWGQAPAGSAVTVRLGTQEASCLADAQGRWITWINTPGPGEITRMTVTCGAETVTFTDVACGEVWLAGGQSNMEQPLMCMEGGAPWADGAAEANVRLKSIPRRCGDKPEAGWHFFPSEGLGMPWQHADRDNAAKFSAIGYVFGAMLAKRLQMPVGVIECNWGGTRIECWLPTEDVLAEPYTRKRLEDYLALRESLGDKARTAFEAYVRTVRQAQINEPDYVAHNLADPLNFLREDRNIAFVPEGALGDPQMPGALFDHMVTRVAPYGLSGVLWYQGEANGAADEALHYGALFGRLLDTWRGAWMDPGLPFLTCQLATFQTSMYWGSPDWPCLRAQQQLCADRFAHVSMAVLLDVGMARNIHPLYKQPVAERLFRLALEDVYGIPAQAHAPRPIACIRQKAGLLLCFDGPVTIRPGELPVLMEGSVPVPCRVTQPDARALLLTAQPSAAFTGAAYAQSDWLTPGLYGENGLPVAPFVIQP